MGCFNTGFLDEILSRKYAILVNVAIFKIGVVIQTSAAVVGVSYMIAGRLNYHYVSLSHCVSDRPRESLNNHEAYATCIDIYPGLGESVVDQVNQSLKPVSNATA